MRSTRISVRRMMGVVAVAALLLAALVLVRERRRQFQEMAVHHQDFLVVAGEGLYMFYGHHSMPDLDGKPEVITCPRLHWHAMLGEKYERAARYPWLPVWPDPPIPKDSLP